GPVLDAQKPRRLVRVVVSGGAPAERSGARAEVERVLVALRAALDDHDEVAVVWIPGDPTHGWGLKRPEDGELLAAVRGGPASLRVVLSDRPAPAAEDDILWVGVAPADASNTGIVGVVVEDVDGEPTLFATLLHQGARGVTGRVEVRPASTGPGSAGAAFAIEPGGAVSVAIKLGALRGQDVLVELVDDARDDESWADALDADDVVRLLYGPLRVAIDARLPAVLRTHITHGLTAVLGAEGFVASDDPILAFGPRGSVPHGVRRVQFEFVADGAEARRAPPGSEALGSDPLVRDLTTAGIEWTYAAGAERVEPDELLMLGRRAPAGVWPVLLRRGLEVRLAPDPLRGSPAPVHTPFWPLWIGNLVVEGATDRVGHGYRAVGLLDAPSSRLGGFRSALAPARLVGLAPVVPGRSRPLRPLLLLSGLLALGLLWALPRVRRARAARANPHGARAGTSPQAHS
ncbi:MAG: hypothetical protein O2894_11130, partial [Planctomycetota bacterium]|nr:hypothetical protein [Planctomycetota bacterium]